MAAGDASPFPIKNQAYRVTFPIFDGDGDLVAGAAGLDSEVSTDAGTFANCTNEATQIATSSGMYYLDLTAAEMNGDTVAIIVKTTTTGAKTTPVVLYPVTLADAMLGVNVSQISEDTTAATNAEAFFDGTGYAGTGNTIPTVTSVTNQVTADTTAISGSTAAADNLEESAEAIITGAATGTPTTTSMNTDITGYADDELIGRLMIWKGGTADGQAATITDYANTNGVVSFDAITTAPAASDPFVIV